MERALRQKLRGGKFQNVSKKRSKTMSAIKGQGNRTTEARLRFAFVGAGLSGWQVHPAGVEGHPDFLFREAKLAIFVDGCFWHGCPKCGHYPANNQAYWREKIEVNRRRDRRVSTHLRQQGYEVIRIWEHELRGSTTRSLQKVTSALLARN